VYALNSWTGRTDAAAELLRKTAASMPLRLRKLRFGVVRHHSGWPRRQASVGTFLGPLGEVLARESTTLSALQSIEVLVDPALPCADPAGELRGLEAACGRRGIAYSMSIAKSAFPIMLRQWLTLQCDCARVHAASATPARLWVSIRRVVGRSIRARA